MYILISPDSRLKTDSPVVAQLVERSTVEDIKFDWSHVQFMPTGIYSRVAQWKRVGLITRRSLDRNQLLLFLRFHSVVG